VKIINMFGGFCHSYGARAQAIFDDWSQSPSSFDGWNWSQKFLDGEART